MYSRSRSRYDWTQDWEGRCVGEGSLTESSVLILRVGQAPLLDVAAPIVSALHHRGQATHLLTTYYLFWFVG